MTRARGIDISGHNKAFKEDPDAFKKAIAAGYSFVFIKATQPNTKYTNNRVREWVDKARDAGMDVGVYDFHVPRVGARPEDDADFFLHAIQGLNTTLRVVNDHEEAYQGRRIKRNGKIIPDPTAKLPADVLVDAADRWALTVSKEVGYAPTFYTYASYLVSRRKAFLACKEVRHGPFWCAKVGKVAPKDCSPWLKWFLWQDSWTGVIPGLDGHVDLNITNDMGLGPLFIPTKGGL